MSWWQHLDEEPLLVPYPNYTTYAFAGGTGFSQDPFGRRHDFNAENPPHVGWRRMTALLGPEHAVPDLTLTFRRQGTNCDGSNVDDVGRDPLLPAGTPLGGFGMAAPGATGDLLVDLAQVVGVAGGVAWAPGAPATLALPVPASPSLAGVAVWFQGALVDFAAARVGLTTGLYEVLGS